jgi:hypothetical protein
VFFRSAGGSPSKVFECKNAAQLECDRLNMQKFKNLILSGEASNYFFHYTEMLPYQSRKNKDFRNRIDDCCKSIFGYSFDFLGDQLNDGSKIEVLESATDENWLEFLSMTNFLFWEVVSVKKG